MAYCDLDPVVIKNHEIDVPCYRLFRSFGGELFFPTVTNKFVIKRKTDSVRPVCHAGQCRSQAIYAYLKKCGLLHLMLPHGALSGNDPTAAVMQALSESDDKFTWAYIRDPSTSTSFASTAANDLYTKLAHRAFFGKDKVPRFGDADADALGMQELRDIKDQDELRRKMISVYVHLRALFDKSYFVRPLHRDCTRCVFIAECYSVGEIMQKVVALGPTVAASTVIVCLDNEDYMTQAVRHFSTKPGPNATHEQKVQCVVDAIVFYVNSLKSVICIDDQEVSTARARSPSPIRTTRSSQASSPIRTTRSSRASSPVGIRTTTRSPRASDPDRMSSTHVTRSIPVIESVPDRTPHLATSRGANNISRRDYFGKDADGRSISHRGATTDEEEAILLEIAMAASNDKSRDEKLRRS